MTQDINSTRQVRFSSDQPTVFTYGYTSDHDEAAADECDQPDELDPCSQLPGSPLPSVLDKILGGDELPATTTSSCQHKRPLHDDSTSQPEAGDTESPPPQDSHKRLHLDVRPLPIPASSPSSSVHSPSSQNDNLHSNNSTPSPNTFTAPLPTHQPASWSDRLASKRLSPDSPFFDGPTALPLLKSVDTQDDSQNDTQDTCDPPFFSNRPLQRSLLPEFLQHLQDHTNDTDPEDDDNDALSDLAELSESFRKSKQRIVDSLFADEEDYNDADFASASTRYTSLLDDADHSDDDEEGIYSSSAFSSLAAPRSGPANSSLNDEIDQFFFTPTTYDCSSSNFDYHTPKLSIDEQQQRFLHYGKSLYLTVWPHFLNMDYFDQHDAKDRSQIDPEDDDVSHTTFAYFDTKFTVIEKLGSGEYADVWKVKPRDSEQVYAVKKLKTSFQSFTDRWRQLMEARNMLAVQDSPHCIHLFNAWEQNGFLYLQMEFGVMSLETFLANQTTVSYGPETWTTLLQIGLGIQAIHDAGVAHLDLKPSNILADEDGVLKIGDFGTSIRCPLAPEEFKGEGDRQYMAPDLIRDEYGKPADMFSFGLIVFKVTTLIDPPDDGEEWEMIRLGDFSNYDKALRKVPWKFREVMKGLLEPQPSDRWAIETFLAGVPAQ